ncbi:MAG: DUF3887 domain-containing protein [Pygmaiobacter massiliensis]|uniref:DUF3887 domain-containing protein n=1 Tax=Pygmaiobacter massiliensis TaxID=1917873 RepID=UPI0028A1F3D8|nr:DUF3887 domain-containing protein [Pygmaiobacter massiliensis]
MMKRILTICLALTMAAGLLTGCGAKPLPDGFDKETVLSAAREIVAELEDEKYDEIAAKMDATLTQAGGAEKIEEVWESYSEQLGNFKEYTEESTFGQDGYGVAVLVAKYEDGTAQFTISFDSEMKLAGFYVK